MKYSALLSFALLGSTLAFTGCNRDKNEKPESSSFSSTVARYAWSPKAENAAAQIRIVNHHGEPVAGAQILVGQAPGNPFRDNMVTTNAAGHAAVSSLWRTPAAVTVDARGYVRQTLLGQAPGNMTIKLNPAPLAQQAELRGSVTQLPVVDGDKLIDFALVMPAVSKADLLTFDMGQVISPYTDTMTAAGQTSEVPSNVSIPKQKESYFISVTLNKPAYRLKVATLGPKKFVTARGRFVFKDVVSELRKGTPFHELINHFTIHGGAIRDVAIVDQITQIDLPGNELQFANVIPVRTASANADEVQMVLATVDHSGSMIPTDVKKATHGQPLNLQSMAGRQAYIVNVIKKQSELMSNAPGADRMSASLVPYSANHTPTLLPLIANPSIRTGANYVINLPAAPSVNGINPTATAAAISDLVEVKEGNKTIILAVKRWEVLGAGWNQQIDLPQWALEGAGRKRVEVKYIGSNTSKSTDIDDRLINNATHVTHASADF